MTIAKFATFSAKYDVLRAVVSAVSVTQMFRAGLLTGSPHFGSTAGPFSSAVGLPFLSRSAASRHRSRPWWLPACGLAAGGLATICPARRAARLKVIEAVVYE